MVDKRVVTQDEESPDLNVHGREETIRGARMEASGGVPDGGIMRCRRNPNVGWRSTYFLSHDYNMFSE